MSQSDDSASESSDDSQASSDDKVAQTNLVESNDDSYVSDEPQASGEDVVGSPADDTASDSNNQADEMSFEDCQMLAEKELEENETFIGQNLIIDQNDHGEIPNCYVFFVLDDLTIRLLKSPLTLLPGRLNLNL